MRRAAVWLLWLVLTLSMRGEDVPQWLRDAAASESGVQSSNVPALVLLNEEQIIVDQNGRIEERVRKAIRILNKEGREAASASMIYYLADDKIKSFHGWMLPASGPPIRYHKDRLIDLAVAPNDVYNESRNAVFAAGSDAQPGSVFGYEMEAERKSVFTQWEYLFQDGLPSLVSRFMLKLPSSWQERSIIYNHAPLEPQSANETYTWEIKNLPFLEDEPHSPDIRALVPRLAVTYLPADGNKRDLAALTDWAAVSDWLTGLSDSQADIEGAVTAKARELTSAARTDLEKIQAIAKFVQGINYAEIQTGMERGGGYKPHLASQVLAKQYGDCKDKANLMRALLKVIGIPAYLVSIYSGERSYVYPDWPSPQTFNHAIIAVKIPDSMEFLSVVRHPTLGRLLIFDPTDPDTPVGQLPEQEQGSYALICAGKQGALLKMPLQPPSFNRAESITKGDVSAQGGVTAAWELKLFGQSAAEARGLHRRDGSVGERLWLERTFSRTINGAKLDSITQADTPGSNEFVFRTSMSAERFAQSMQGRLFVLKPGAFAGPQRYFFPDKERKLPIVLEAESWSDTVQLRLPTGFKVDELPDAVDIEARYGKYKASWSVNNNELLFQQAFEVQNLTLPASNYSDVRGFFERVNGAALSPVVLVRDDHR